MVTPRNIIKEFIQANPGCTEAEITEHCDSKGVPAARVSTALSRMIRNKRIIEADGNHTWASA